MAAGPPSFISNSPEAKVVTYSPAGSEKSQGNHKPIFIVLIILGVIGIGAAGVGFVAIGTHQKWWMVGALSNLSQVNALIMIGAGGGAGIVLLLAGIIGRVKCEEVPLTLHALRLSYHSTDATYPHSNNDGIVDLVYIHEGLGIGCIVDGAGYNNPQMKQALIAHFKNFLTDYYKRLQKNLQTKNRFETFFTEKIRQLEIQFKDKNNSLNKVKVFPAGRAESDFDEDPTMGTFLQDTYKPAMSLVQVLKGQNSLFLFSAQAGDTMAFVEMKNGDLIKVQEPTSGLVGGQEPINIHCQEITGAKRIIGFSGGIGSYVTFQGLKDIVEKNKDSSQLFDALKDEIKSPHQVTSNTKAVNGESLKIGTPDDMGFFALDL